MSETKKRDFIGKPKMQTARIECHFRGCDHFHEFPIDSKAAEFFSHHNAEITIRFPSGFVQYWKSYEKEE